MYFCEFDYMCTWFVLTVFMHINLSAHKYGECSLLFSCGWDKNVSAGRQSGWDAIIGMYKWECERRSKENARMVPKLRKFMFCVTLGRNSMSFQQRSRRYVHTIVVLHLRVDKDLCIVPRLS